MTHILCNCRYKHECSLKSNCVVKNIVLSLFKSRGVQDRGYVGVTRRICKERYYNDNRIFKINHYSSSKTLSKFSGNNTKTERKLHKLYEQFKINMQMPCKFKT